VLLKLRHVALYKSIIIIIITRSSADADKPDRCAEMSVKVTKHGTIPYVWYGFLLVCYSNFVRIFF